jgi:TPP-dependent pyruvate/acetoin dehydrogenase alpha subunit
VHDEVGNRTLTREGLGLALYSKMYLIRTAENAIRATYTQDAMKTPMHMSTGEEGICAGVCQALAPGDQVLGTYRSHGLYLARTGETDRFFAEMYGRASGMAKGKGGSMHLTAPADGLICTSAIVGTTIPVAVGAAYAHKVRNSGHVTAVFFGDGALDEGVFWESVNVACSMRVPVLFVCEDNGYAVHSPKHERHGYRSIVEVMAGFSCAVFAEESPDAEAVYEVARKAIDAVRSGGGPAFLHLRYYRFLEHVGINEDFDQGYRSRDEAKSWLEADPVATMRARLTAGGRDAAARQIEEEIDAKVRGSVDKATAAPFPEPAELHRDVVA